MKRTTLCALPLMLHGLVFLLIGNGNPVTSPEYWVFLLIGGFYTVTALMLMQNPSRIARTMGVVAWAPFFLCLPIGTYIAVMAIKTLRNPDCNDRPQGPPIIALSPSGRSALVARLLDETLGVDCKGANATRSFTGNFGIPSGRLISFLDDLRTDHGFQVTAADADSIDTPQDLLDLLELRHPHPSPPLPV